MEAVKRQVKVNKYEIIPAWAYLLITILIFVLVCFLMGHTEWIYSVLTQNTVSDLTGETPRFLAAEYFDVIAYTPNFSQAARDEIVVKMAEAMLPQIPAAFLFSNIDSFITDRVKKDSFTEKFICFCAAYVLQAIIAVSCIEPVTWMDAVVNCVKLIMIIWLLGGIIYYVYNVFSGNSDIGSIVNDIVSVMMAALYPIGKEIIKLVFLTTLFSVSLYIINGILGLVGIGQIITLSAILMTVYYIVLNRLLDKAADAISEKFIIYISSQTDLVYRKFFVGELFCFIVCIIVIISAISLSI